MKTTHTPGPWNRGFGNEVYRGERAGADQPLIAVCYPTKGTREELEITFANARLIAAAPEMLALLQAISTLDELHTTSLPWDFIMKIRAAIAKATGGTEISQEYPNGKPRGGTRNENDQNSPRLTESRLSASHGED